MPRIERDTILARLRGLIAERKPIVGAGPGPVCPPNARRRVGST